MNKLNNLVQRVESIDILRGITILVMIFVNDIPGVHGLPAWMKHNPPGTGGMTFVDVVFPAFLFIVGMSIPFAIGKRLERGDSLWNVWKHILIRTLGLLIIGVLMANSDTISDTGLIPPGLWILLMYAGVILVWNQPARNESGGHAFFTKWRIAGIVVLLVSIFLYRGTHVTGIMQIRTQWWGILGLIGWAYLVACIVYIPLRKNISGLIGMMALLYCFYVADEMGLAHWAQPWITPSYTLGSHPAIIIAGVILGMILKPDSVVPTPALKIRWAFLYALGMFVAGILLHSLHSMVRFFIIDKNMATLPWCLISSAITVWVWIVIYWLVDIKGWKRWAVVVRPAGSNALFAYILAPIFYVLFDLISSALGYDFYAALGSTVIAGILRGIVFAFAMTWLTGGLRRVGIWLRL